MNAPMPPDAVAVAMLPVAQIAPSPSNPRKHFDNAYIVELAESIKLHGLVQPITVRPNPAAMVPPGIKPPYQIVVGECRWRAAKLAGMADIPGFWRELDDKQVLEIQIVENLNRRDVHALEEADGYRVLIDRHGYTADTIAEKIGKSRAYVYARLKLTALCEYGRDAFFAKLLDASTALLVARIRGETLQKKAVKALATEGYDGGAKSFRDAKYYIKNNFTVSLKQATFKPGDATLLPSAGSCTDCPQRSGNDPAIFADIEDGDVCTDVKCFDAKQLARHDQLIANAEKRKIPVLRGEAVKEAAPSGFQWSLDADRYVSLDDECDGDAGGRTYREILGDKAPVAALIEFGNSEANKHIVECAEPTALAKALKKAGWEPSPEVPNDNGQPRETPQDKAEREALQKAEQAAYEARQQAREGEQERRATLLSDIVASLQSLGSLADHVGIMRHLIIGFIREHFTTYDPETTLMADDFGYQRLEDEDDAEFGVVCKHALAAIEAWDLPVLLAFTAAMLGHEDKHPDHDWQDGDKAPLLDPLAEVLGLSTPTQAAQAQEVGAKPEAKAKAGKKSKAKAGTAATASPNEPAAPVETGSTLLPAWPFPTGCRT